MSRPNNLWPQQQTYRVGATEEPLTDVANQKNVHFHKVNTSEQFPDTDNVHFDKVNTSKQRDICTLLTLIGRQFWIASC